MPNRVEDVSLNKNSATRLLFLLGVAVLIITAWMWWTKIHNSSNNVFWGMINNNLASSGVTRHIYQKNESQELDQYIQLEFGSVNAARGLSIFKQSGNNGGSAVTTETLGIPTSDYNRYVRVKTSDKTADDKTIDTSKFVGIWAKNDITANEGDQYFRQSVLTIVPYGNLSTGARRSLVDFIKDKDVYRMSKPAESKTYNGRSAYVYYIEVNPVAYIESLQKYSKALGIDASGLSPEQYANSPPLKVEFTVDKLSRQLVKIYYPDSQQEETFMAQGLMPQTKVPSQTVTPEELQKKLQ
jgi:hypothetical protein